MGGGWGIFCLLFLEGGTRRPLHETKICQFIELRVGNRKMAKTFFFPLFLPLKPCPPLWPSPSPSTFMPMSLSHWLFAISFSLYLSSLFCFVYSVINTRPNAINTLAFLLQIVLLLEMLKFSKIIFSKRNVL